MPSEDPTSSPERGTLIALLGIPLICFLLAAAVYKYAISTSSMGKLQLSGRASPYPDNRPGPTKDLLFGQEVLDPYRWLENGNEPAVAAWMDAQNQLTRAFLDSLPQRPRLIERFKELYYLDAIGAPTVMGGRWFYKRRNARQEKSLLCWRQGANGEERVLMDPSKLSEDGSMSLGTWVPSRDGRLLAYELNPNNADESTLYVMEVATGKDLPGEVITGAKYAFPSWLPDSSGFFYTWVPEVAPEQVADRPGMAQFRFHRLGTPPSEDPVVHPATHDPKTFLHGGISWDGRWLILSISHGWNRNDLYFQDLAAAPPSPSAWRPLVTGKDAQTDVTDWAEHFYYRTNDGAPRFKLVRGPAGDPDPARLVEIVPQHPEAVLESAMVIGGRLVLQYLRNAHSALEIRELDGKLLRQVALPAPGEIYQLNGQPDDPLFYYGFSSFTIPPEIFETSADRADSALWARIEVPVDPTPYEVKQVWYESRDGTKISMFLIFNRNIFLNGQTPFLLTGYGGFGLSETPSFMSNLFPWLEAGGGVAIPNLRGGGEYGEDWHRAGMLHKKQNTFDDFIAAAEYLIRERYTSADRLGIKGGSNGGLLLGAAITQRPELFRAAICAVPLLDMIRYHLFGSGKTWIPEYGSPDHAEDFKHLFAYSPYHRTRAGGHYPATLFLSSANDDRVDPMHARKMAALLQQSNASPFPILLRVEAQSGHAGADQVKKAVDLSADWMAFLMNELQVDPSP
jgi:prolyl oligopeptidase